MRLRGDFQIGSGKIDLPIPKGHKTDQIPVWYHRPKNLSPAGRVVIVLHGISRGAQEARDNWKSYSDKNGFVLAVPEFRKEFFSDAAYSTGNLWDPVPPIQRIAWHNTYGCILELLFARIRAWHEGCDKFTLYGHSAGAAFAHRYMTFAPIDLVDQGVLANAGWYTTLDRSLPQPFGLLQSDLSEDRVAKFLGKPITILLGENDTVDSPMDWWPKEYKEQGGHRVARGINYFFTAQALAKKLGVPFRWSCQLVPGVGHENKKMIEPAMQSISTYLDRAGEPFIESERVGLDSL
jgi:pimeloyl-ACP methyl ester carboxylesterase